MKAQLTYLTTKSSHILDSRGTHDGKKTLTEAEIDRVVRRFENQWGERHSPKLGHRMRISGGYDPEALARLIRGLSA